MYLYQEATTHNLVLAIYGFSKITSARDFLYGPTVLIDKVLNRLGDNDDDDDDYVMIINNTYF